MKTKYTLSTEDHDRLAELKEEMKANLEEARQLVRGTSEEDRAKGYWLAHIAMALDDDHGYLGSGGATMQEAIDALEPGGPGDRGDEEEDDEAEHDADHR